MKPNQTDVEGGAINYEIFWKSFHFMNKTATSTCLWCTGNKFQPRKERRNTSNQLS